MPNNEIKPIPAEILKFVPEISNEAIPPIMAKLKRKFKKD